MLLLAFLAFNLVSERWLGGVRLDLTENGQYTLSDGSRRILAKIDTPIELTLYYSAVGARDIPQLRVYAEQVRDLLDEYALRAGGALSVRQVDPEPFSEAEDRAVAEGVQPVRLGGDKVYFGLVARSGETHQAIAFLQPQRAPLLEYDLSKLLQGLQDPVRPVVGVLTDLPIGGYWDPSRGPVAPWQVYRDVGQLFDIKDLQAPLESIDPAVQVLWVVHPKQWDAKTRYAIDQFIMRGGRAVIFVDPFAEAEPIPMGQHPLQARSLPHYSDLPETFQAWGLHYAHDRILLDRTYALGVRGPNDPRPLPHPAVLGLRGDAIAGDDIATAQLDQLNLGYAGALSWQPVPGVTVTPLVQSSAEGRLAPAEVVQNAYDPAALLAPAETGEGGVRSIAVRLGGVLPSGFAAPPEGVDNPGHLSRSRLPASVVVVADVDLLADGYWVRTQEFASQIVVRPFADNGDLLTNALETLTGGEDLIGIRSRAVTSRPFERVEALRAGAELRFRSKEQELQGKLADTEAKLAELDRGDDAGAALTAEQQQALARFQAEKWRIRRELREVRHRLNQDIDALGTRLKLANIGLMPLLVAALGLAVAALRRRRRRQGD